MTSTTATAVARGAGSVEPDLTVIVPAYNEAASVGDTIRSLQAQSVPPTEIIVVDDGSTDATSEVARACGVTVVRPPANTGSKAGAQSFALPMVRTSLTMAIDADTTLAPDAIEKLLPAFEDPNVAAACGYVLPRHVESIWERGRYVEYLFAFSFYKQIQDHFGKPTISSGCFSMYRTDRLREVGGWSQRTLAEDMDLTWTFFQRNWGVRFIPEAVSYPIEPHDLHFMRSQLRRWSHGFVQNVRLHGRGVLGVPFLRFSVAVAIWDATVATAAYFLVLPLLAMVLGSAWPLIGYAIDVPVLLVPVLAGAIPRREVRKAIASLPGFFCLRLLNSLYFLEAVWSEVVRGRRFAVYEKGH
ncbi:MAG: poly-beta,6-N-acetyl-D-glucosamine synthase [Chloroflexota bacterium]|nr:poly-beta,6-N-acetyl-D-glucosamine synthase [Chloroflexota bacterium]